MTAIERAIRLTRCLYSGGQVSQQMIMQRFGVSRATATRDMTALEQHLPVKRYDGKLWIQ